MTEEEYAKRIDSVIDQLCSFKSLQDELLKLMCLFTKCMPSIKHDGKEFLSRDYVLEKVSRIIMQIPLILDEDAKMLFISTKLAMEDGNKNE